MDMDFDLQTAIIGDVLLGIHKIHQSSVKMQGNLSSYCCLIDKYFTLKIGDVRFCEVKRLIIKENADKEATGGSHTETINPNDDILQLAVILCQIILREDRPRSADDSRTLLSRDTDKFPSLFASVRRDLLLCTDRVPDNRPSITYLAKCFAKAQLGQFSNELNLVERMVRRVETYIAELDRQVEVRTQALRDEREKCDLVLREMLPSLIVEQLRKGMVADREIFESATIMFTEIGGFISILQSGKATVAMAFLNDVYFVFDTVLDRYNVSKWRQSKIRTWIRSNVLEQVVSGVPQRNGNLHAKEICTLAVSLFKAYSPFQPLFDETSLRAGIHSGSCAAGVVGHRTPRYCLFGDTVNVASRMLSHGEDGRVHLSRDTADLLEAFPDMKPEQRGETDIKGKGKMNTFWLPLI